MFKIKNDNQKAKALKRIHQFQKDIEKIRADKGEKGAAWFRKVYGSLVDEFAQQVKHYESLKTKGVPEFEGSDLTQVGSYLVDARIASGLTQGQLAQKLKVSQPMVFKYENAEYENCGPAIIERVIEALKIDLTVALRSEHRGVKPMKPYSAHAIGGLFSRVTGDIFFAQLAGGIHA